MIAPSIENSTQAERLAFIHKKFECISDCDACGNCIILGHRVAEIVFDDYIKGIRSFTDIATRIRDQK